MPIHSFEGRTPRIAPTAYVDPSAVVIGKVFIGDNCYIGSGAVLIAPLELKDGSHVGAGTVVSQESVNELGGKAKTDVS